MLPVRLAADLGPQLAPLRRQYPKTYGKVQAKNPGRRLTREQAYALLIGACHDGTVHGLRDEIGLRLGLSGMRLSEIVNLTWGGFDGVTRRITYTGKGRKPRTVTAGAALVDALDRYGTEYERRLGRPLTDADPVLCRRHPGPKSTGLRWGVGLSDDALARAVADRAQQAGLGHVAPHDLRRTAAGILHSAVSADGAHHVDLLDIPRLAPDRSPGLRRAVLPGCAAGPPGSQAASMPSESGPSNPDR